LRSDGLRLGALCFARSYRPHHWRRIVRLLPALAFVGLVDLALHFYLISKGERWISSSLTGLLLAAMPFVVALLSIAVDRSEHVTGWQVGGLAIGIGGVAVLLGFGGRDRESLLGAALVAAATVLYSVGALAVKRWLADVPLRASTAATLVIAAVALALERLQRLPCIFPALPRSSQLPDSA
jgi:drug/metabolite transporter (DMT)-like permease